MGKGKPPGGGKKPRKRRVNIQVAGAIMGAPDAIIIQFADSSLLSAASTSTATGIAPGISTAVSNLARLNIPAVKVVQVNQAFTHQISLHASAATGGTFTAVGLPAGTTINSSTGLISGTVTSAGVHDYEVTYSLGAGIRQNHRVVSRIHVYTSLVQINGTTPVEGAAGGAYAGTGTISDPWKFIAPHNYDNNDTCYQYAGHCRYDTQAGFTSGTNIAIDLNGKTIEWDANTSEISITNGNFGTGNTNGWTTIPAGVTVATGTIAARTAWTDGGYAAVMPMNASETKILKTSNVNLVAGRYYQVSWLLLLGASAAWSEVRVLVGTNDSNSRGTGELWMQSGNWRPGGYGSYVFQADSNQTVPIEFHITNVDTASHTFYLTECAIVRAKVTGISSGNDQINHPYTDATATGTINANVTLFNGVMTQLNRSHGIGYRINGAGCPLLDTVTLTSTNRVQGGSNYPIQAAARNGLMINNCTLDNTCTRISSRDNLHGAMASTPSGGGSSTGTHFNGNTVLRSAQTPHFSPRNTVGHTFAATCDSNTITHGSHYTNGFALYGPNQSDHQGSMAFNVVTAPNGRGIRMRSYCNYHDNVVDCEVLPTNLEYAGYQLNGAYTMQLESTPYSIDIRNETYITRGAGSGTAFRHSSAATGDAVPVRDCTLEVIATTGSPPVSPHTCIRMGHGVGSAFTFTNCTLKSNYHLWELHTADVTSALTFNDCTFEIDDGAYYPGTPWNNLTGGSITVNTPVTYVGLNTQTEIETQAASDPLVTVP